MNKSIYVIVFFLIILFSSDVYSQRPYKEEMVTTAQRANSSNPEISFGIGAVGGGQTQGNSENLNEGNEQIEEMKERAKEECIQNTGLALQHCNLGVNNSYVAAISQCNIVGAIPTPIFSIQRFGFTRGPRGLSFEFEGDFGLDFNANYDRCITNTTNRRSAGYQACATNAATSISRCNRT